MGAVTNMRPDLFKIVVADVPFVDVINTMLDPSLPLTVEEYEEWGNPEDKQYYDYMKSYSPYDNVEAKNYPNMLITAGLNDPRVKYWEPLKFTAKLRALKTDKNILLLKTNMGAGHGGSSGRYDYLKEIAFQYAFIFDILGIQANISENTVKGRYWYFVDNIKPEKGKSSELLLWVALPINHTGQSIKIKEIYPSPSDIIDDPVNENKIVLWQVKNFKNKEQIYFYYDFEVIPKEVKFDIDPKNITEYDKKSKEYIRYTKSEAWIEITPEIKKKAKEIVGKENNPYLQAKKIFSWVITNMNYEYPDIKQRGSEKSFKKLKGDCGEFSVVFCSLCRALGIPARTVTCVWFSRAGHQWAEILLPPYGWVPVDSSVAQLLKPDYKIMAENEVEQFMQTRKIPVKDPYYLFGNLYPNRLIVSIGNNIDANSAKTGIKKTFSFLQPGGATAYPAGIELKGLSQQTVHCGFFLFGEKRDDMNFAIEKSNKDLSGAYLHVGLYDKAEKGLLKKLEENPDDAQSWMLIGQVYMNKNNPDKAINAFKQAIEGKAGSIKPIIEAWSHNLLGNCYDIKGERKLAIEEYNKVIKMNINFDGSLDYAKKYLKEPFKESSK